MTTTFQTPIARLRIPKDAPPLIARDADDWPAYWQRLRERLARDGYRTGTLRLYRHVLRDLRTFLLDHYQACILPTVTNPLDPDSPELILRQMNALLGRLAMTLSTLQPTQPQAP